MIRQSLLLGVLTTLLCACSTLTPPPRDHFYRVQLEPLEMKTFDADEGGTIFVAPLSASGLHSERAIISVSADGTTLLQSSYHFWIDSPRHMLQRELADYLSASLARPTTVEPMRGAEYVVRAHIQQFERITGAATPQVVAVLVFEVFAGDTELPVLSRRYARTREVGDATVAGAVRALNAATGEIFAAFAADMQTLR